MFSCFNTTQVRIDGSIKTFLVKARVGGEENVNRIVGYEVLYNTEELEVHCICNMFNFKGYLCKHALSVLHYNGVSEIPTQYILSRWRKDFKRIYNSKNSIDVNFDNSAEWYDQLFKCAIQVVEEGVVSKDHFEIALDALKDSLRRIHHVKDKEVESTPTVVQPILSKETRIKDPKQAKRPGRRKQSRIKGPIERTRKTVQNKKTKSKERMHISSTTLVHVIESQQNSSFESTMAQTIVLDNQQNFESMDHLNLSMPVGSFQSLLMSQGNGVDMCTSSEMMLDDSTLNNDA